jgi:hypothetical protein
MRLPLLYMRLSFVTSDLGFIVVERQSRHCFAGAVSILNPFLFPSIREYMERSSQATRRLLRSVRKSA